MLHFFFLFFIVSELYLLTKNAVKYLLICLVVKCRSTTFASAFRKEDDL